jgi:transglutaminase-like putative cysteine protease
VSDRDRLSIAAGVATALATATLLPVFGDLGWLLAVLGVVVVVTAASMLARAARVPAVLVPVATAGAALGYVTAVFAGGVAVAGLLPGPGAMRALRDLADVGFADVHGLAAPVPANPGLVLLAVCGVGGVAVLVDALAAGLRRPPIAGLPLLGLYAVPAAVAPHGVGLLAFVLGVTGFLVLLAADNRDRLARWGRPLRTSAQLVQPGRLAAAAYGEEPATGAMGRRIGVSAIGFALVVPLLTPTVRPSIFTGNGAAGHGTGTATAGVTTYNPIVRLRDQLVRPEPRKLLELRTSDTAPARYLRMAALDRFDGRTWSQSPLQAGKEARLPAGLPEPVVAGATVKTSIRVTDALDARWLPLPYQPTSVRLKGDWRYDRETDTVFSAHDNVRGRSYRVRATRLEPTDRALADVRPLDTRRRDLLGYLDVPERLPSSIVETAKQFDKASDSPYARALRIQNFFTREKFAYSTSVPAGNSSNAIVNFLEQRQGYCEQFAATMALFARLNNIPARVAVGFTYGTQQPDGSYVITTHDAHAWPELYFSGLGWLPFEPTPTGARGEGAVAPRYASDATSALLDLDKRGNGGPDELASRAGKDKLGDRAGEDQDTAALADQTFDEPAAKRTAGHGIPTPVLVGLGVLAAVLLVLPSLLRVLRRFRRHRRARTWVEETHAAWADLREDAADLGYRWRSSASPRGARAWLLERAALPPEARHALDVLVAAEERARYAQPGSPCPASVASVRVLERSVARAVAHSTSPRGRWLARVAPTSSLDGARRVLLRGSSAVDAVDRYLAGAIRRRLRRRPA